jgi:hypothetical protein
VIISDYVAGLSIHMNLEEHAATVTHFPRNSAPVTPNTTTKVPNSVDPKGTHAEEDLPSKEIQGFMVTGKRYINTTAAGQTSTLEQWYSPDLKFMLLSTGDSPQAGNFKDEVVNIHRGEPDQSVFHVPEGFTVKNLYCRGKVCNYDSE